FSCVEETVNITLPLEVDYLTKYDRLNLFIKNYIDTPDNLVDLLIRILSQHQGKLSKRAREREFIKLTEQEILEIQQKYSEVFSD
ncbi:MAG: hypothetical protein JXR59_09210, partial [Desulfuromonadaceae bacterium]|nr:hypothetical protein [Desulfuromonadaceae bacterium]